MDLIRSIKSRMPGGGMYEAVRAGRILKNTSGEDIYSVFLEKYFHGYSAGINKFAEITNKRYLRDNILDFGIFKMIAGDFGIAWYEMLDLIYPYIEPSYSVDLAAQLGEGPYEMFGVQVEKGDVVIDAGANMGIFTLFSAKYRGAFVHAFEPVPTVFNILLQNIRINYLEEKVKMNQMGLYDSIGNAEIAICPDNLGGASLMGTVQEKAGMDREKITITTVDEYVKRCNLQRVDFIKADIEGAERKMLAGAVETMKRFQPKLAICTYHLSDDKDVLTEIILKANPNYKLFYTRKKLFAK